MLVRMVATLALALMFTARSSAAQSPVLAGLSAVKVNVHIDGQMPAASLDRNAIADAVAQQLVAHGWRIVEPSDSGYAAAPMVFGFVLVTPIRSDRSVIMGYTVHAELRLTEWVRLERNNARVAGATWAAPPNTTVAFPADQITPIIQHAFTLLITRLNQDRGPIRPMKRNER